MFLPFLPLILASAGLTLFPGELERTEPWLNLSFAVNLSLIILVSFLLAQMPEWLRQFSKLKRFPEVRKESYSSTKFSRPRTMILIGWLALVYGEHLDLRIGHLFKNFTAKLVLLSTNCYITGNLDLRVNMTHSREMGDFFCAGVFQKTC